MKSVVKGFTLLELMVTLAVLVVTLTLGVPAFAGLQQRARTASAFHLLTTSLATARLSAVKHGEAVSICPSSDGQTCRDGVVWDDGWILFADPEHDDQPASVAAVLQRIDGISNGLALRSTQGRTQVRFTPNGWAYNSNLSIRLCDEKNALLLGKVVVNNAGRPRSERYDEAPACPYVP